MKYTVIVGGNPYTVDAEVDYENNGVHRFVDFNHEANVEVLVAEFGSSKIDGIILEDNNA